jgi:hypothetical protein
MPQYSTIWRNKFLTTDSRTLDDMIERLEAAVAELQGMKKAGVVLQGGAEDDYATLVTTDPVVAGRFDMNEKEYEDEEFEDA